ncbi:MAG: 2-polyprenylphenol 6-hydroxylase [Bauldia sp.]
MTIAALARLAYAGIVLAREGAAPAGLAEQLPPIPRFLARAARSLERRDLPSTERASRLTTALNRLGPSYVKLGQFLATRPDLVGRELATALGGLRDEMAPFPMEAARETIARELGAPVESLYSAFSDPVAAASIAQVHRATVREGEATRTVAVKVLRPGIALRFRRDLATFYAGARLAGRFDPSLRRLRLIEVVDTLARSVAIEMDLRLEAAALAEMAEKVEGGEGFRVPAVDWARSSREVLTLEWIDGTKLSDLSALKAAGHDLPKIAARLIQAFLRQALRDGFFHADLHQGNLFVEADGGIVAVDFGIMGRIGPRERRFLAEVLYGFIKRDYRRIAEVHFEAGYVPPRHSVEDFAQALRAIGEPIHGQSAASISMAKLLMLLFEVTELFDMATRPELLLLQKTMVVVEGVARSLDPDFDMWAAAEPVVAQWIERHLGPAGRLEEAARNAGSLAALVGTLPVLAERAERLAKSFADMSESGLRLDERTVNALAREEARAGRATRIALWVIAAVLLVALLRGRL